MDPSYWLLVDVPVDHQRAAQRDRPLDVELAARGRQYGARFRGSNVDAGGQLWLPRINARWWLAFVCPTDRSRRAFRSALERRGFRARARTLA